MNTLKLFPLINFFLFVFHNFINIKPRVSHPVFVPNLVFLHFLR